MANVYFYLKEPNKPKSLIFSRISFTYFELNEKGGKIYKQIKISTGESINPKYWDKENQKVKETKEFPQHPEFNQRLKDLETIFLNVYWKMLNDGNKINPITLKENILKYLIKSNKIVEPPKQINDFTYFIKTVIDKTKRGDRVITKTGKKFAERTIKSYNNTLINLLMYEKENKIKLKFSDINLNFYNKYIEYLNSKLYAVNTIGGHIKNIKVFMQIALKEKLTENTEFQSRDFCTVEEEINSIYLNESELKRIYQLDLSNQKKYENVRDVFIIGCYTGLRFSDLKQLQKEHFNFENNIIKIESKKTGKTVVIPLHSTVKEIFNKYGYNLPRVISNQKMNDYLKHISKHAQINDIVEHSRTQGGLKRKVNLYKYELVTVHTARRSFATNSFISGIPAISIMKITGHKTEKSFLKYIKISDEENAKLMMKHSFFNQSNLIAI